MNLKIEEILAWVPLKLIIPSTIHNNLHDIYQKVLQIYKKRRKLIFWKFHLYEKFQIVPLHLVLAEMSQMLLNYNQSNLPK